MLAMYITCTVRRMRCAVCNINFPKKWRDIRSSINVMYCAFPVVGKVGEHLSISNSCVWQIPGKFTAKTTETHEYFFDCTPKSKKKLVGVIEKKRKVGGIESSDNSPLNVRCYEVLTESFESKLCCFDHLCLTIPAAMKGTNMYNYLYRLLCNRWSEWYPSCPWSNGNPTPPKTKANGKVDCAIPPAPKYRYWSSHLSALARLQNGRILVPLIFPQMNCGVLATAELHARIPQHSLLATGLLDEYNRNEQNHPDSSLPQ